MILSNFIAGLITFVLSFLLLFSIWVIFSNDLIYLFKSFNTSRFRKDIVSASRSPLYDHVSAILEIVYNTSSQFICYSFIFGTALIFLLSFVLLSKSLSLFSALIVSVLFAGVPYLYLRLKLHTHRVSISYEAEKLVTELLNQYRINYFNMYEAIDSCVKYLSSAPHSQKHLWRLSMSLKEYRSDSDLMKALNRFHYGIDTLWAQMLVNNMYLAIIDNTNVCLGLEDILTLLKNAKAQNELYKRLNTEGFSIVRLLAPGFYVLSIYLAVKHFGFTVKKFFENQLLNPLGLRFFMIIIILFIVNLLTIAYVNRRKFDF